VQLSELSHGYRFSGEMHQYPTADTGNLRSSEERPFIGPEGTLVVPLRNALKADGGVERPQISDNNGDVGFCDDNPSV
jgi:hypothetical protein